MSTKCIIVNVKQVLDMDTEVSSLGWYLTILYSSSVRVGHELKSLGQMQHWVILTQCVKWVVCI